MAPLTTSHLALLVLTYLSAFVSAQKYWCFENGNYTTNSTYHNNVKTLLSSLPPNMGDSAFYNASLGQNSDRINAIALCRADLQINECRSCVRNGAEELVKKCPYRKQALVWYDVCMLRYSNESFLGNRDSIHMVTMWNLANATRPDQFYEDLRRLLDDLLSQAASGGSLMKVAAGNMTGPDFMNIFGLLQCTPDLSEQDCTACLIACAAEISSCCQNSKGVRIVVPSCNLRYEVYPYYNITRIEEAQRMLSTAPVPVPGPPPMPQVPSPPGKGDNNTARTVVIVVVPIISSLILVACFGIWLTKRTKKPQKETQASDDNDISTPESFRYDFNEIREATNSFSDTNKLGEGGFGAVYKGKLQNGQDIAVKRLFRGSAQGDLEFCNEVTLLAKLQHRNLVRLIGFAQEGIERVLIYELIQNKSLDHFIFDPTRAHYLDWNRRLKIIGGIAKGLLYLHEDSRLRIIHLDLKPSNILLDANMNPKIADFGLAKLYEHDESEVNASKIAGTYGYMAPEYAMEGQFSVKSDVFSFGVLVLEIISAQKNNNFQSEDTIVGEGLLNFAWRNWNERKITNVMDPILRSTPGCYSEITRCIHIALLCIQRNAFDRPTIASVVLMLSSSAVTLQTPSKPTFFAFPESSQNTSLHEMDSRDLKSKNSSDVKLAEPSPLSENDTSITESHPR